MTARIMIVEDHRLDREYLETYLGSRGYEVSVAANGAEALEAAGRQALDLVFSNVGMPVMNGLELCQRWMSDEALWKTPMVLYSATLTEPGDEELAMALGAVGFIRNDTTLDGLGAKIEAFMGRRLCPTRRPPGLDDVAFLRKYNQRLQRMLTHDVGELALAHEQNRQGEARSLAILDQAFDAMVAVNTELEICDFNRSAQEILGYALEEVRGRPLFDVLIPSHEHERQAGLLQLLISGQGPISDESQVLARDGRLVDVRLKIASLGPGLGYAAMIHDITEEKKTREALEVTRDNLERLLTASPAVIYFLDVDGETLRPKWISGNITDLYGYQPQETLEEGWWFNNIHEEDRAQALETSRKILEDGWMVHEYRFRTRDGEVRWIHDELRLLRDAAGAPREVVGTWLDITAQRRAEEQRRCLEVKLVQAQKMEAVGALAGGVAHDFNNNLAVILACGEIVREGLGSGHPMLEDIEQMICAGKRSASLINQLLTFSRKQLVEFKELDLNVELMNLESLLGRLLNEQVNLQFKLTDAGCLIHADPSQLHQVVLNLAINARDAMPNGGDLCFSTSIRGVDESEADSHLGLKPGTYVVLEVSDTGYGMDEETSRRAFEPFFTTKEQGQGTGLGLAMVHGMVKQNSGYLSLDSEPGGGSTFRILLPHRSGSSLSPNPAEHERAEFTIPGGDETILLAEDNDAVRRIAQRILSARGYQVLEAANGGEALLLCESHEGPIDLLLSDVIMPRMNAFDLGERLLSIRPLMAVMFMTGYTDDGAAFARERAKRRMLRKPFSPEQLLRGVRSVLDETCRAVGGEA